jgi:hypothetical protein
MKSSVERQICARASLPNTGKYEMIRKGWSRLAGIPRSGQIVEVDLDRGGDFRQDVGGACAVMTSAR